MTDFLTDLTDLIYLILPFYNILYIYPYHYSLIISINSINISINKSVIKSVKNQSFTYFTINKIIKKKKKNKNNYIYKEFENSLLTDLTDFLTDLFD